MGVVLRQIQIDKIVFVLLFSNYLIYGAGIDRKILIIEVPKSGAHLLGRCIRLLTGKRQLYIGRKPGIICINGKDLDIIDQKLRDLGNNKFYHAHISYTPECEQFLRRNDLIVFYLYRDPRDQIVSYAHWLKGGYDAGYEAAKLDLSLNELMFDLIAKGTIYDISFEKQRNIYEFYNSFLPWMQSSFVCTIKFENLVGPRGYDSADKSIESRQIEEIEKVAKHLGMNPSYEEIKTLANRIFGHTYSFRKGKVGGWKGEFTEEHKKIFNEVTGQLLVDLGYEV